jgi:hypothetical protein
VCVCVYVCAGGVFVCGSLAPLDTHSRTCYQRPPWHTPSLLRLSCAGIRGEIYGLAHTLALISELFGRALEVKFALAQVRMRACVFVCVCFYL